MNNKALGDNDIQNDVTKHHRDIIGNINAAIGLAVAAMGVIHIAATFTPLINGGLEVLSPAKRQAMTYMSLMCGILLIVCGLLIAMLHMEVKEHPFLQIIHRGLPLHRRAGL